jgi:hypothetical protein
MTEIIKRVYGTSKQATGAVAALKEASFDKVVVVSRPSRRKAGSDEETAAPAGEDLPPDGLANAIADAGVPGHQVSIYAEAINRGGSLVTVDAPWGFAVKAKSIMAGFNPIDVGIPDSTVPEFSSWDEAAPLSKALNWQVLKPDSERFSGFWNVFPLLTEGSPHHSWWGFGLLSDDPTPLSSKIGMLVLSEDPTPLSSKTGTKVLSDNPAPLSSALGWKVLLNSPNEVSSSSAPEHVAPLSTKAGIAVLSDDPAPLSAKFGWRLLLDDPTPLSSWLKIPTILKDRSEKP